MRSAAGFPLPSRAVVILSNLAIGCLMYSFASASSDFGYSAVKDPVSSSFMCGALSTYTTTVVGRSSIDCAQQCSINENCVGFNFIRSDRMCHMFPSVPSLSYLRDCIYYTAGSIDTDQSCVIDQSKDVNITFTPAQNCSFPFTYNGQLYYNCIQNVTTVTQCDQYACVMPGRVWAICSSSTGYQVQNSTSNIIIPTIGTTAAMQVNDWIIFQQRVDDSFNWYLQWTQYKTGFGALAGNYWMGNENVHLLTNSGKYTLRMEMMSTTMGWVSAEYTKFYVDAESDYYRLHVGGYSGDTGDCMCYNDTWSEGWYIHDTMQFTTWDSDHDTLPTGNCASMRSSGWWFNRCQWVNVNGHWGDFFQLWTLPDPNTNGYLAASRMMMKRF